MYTENSNLPHGHGELQLNKFEAFPKNRPITKVFRKIVYADELGSGVRNTNKYTKLYSGGTPTFIEDNVFRINVPIDNVANLKVEPGAENFKEGGTLEHSAMKLNIDLLLYAKLRDFLQVPKTRKEIQEFCGYKSRDYLRKIILNSLIELGKIKLTIPDKPQSSKQKYVWHNIDIE